MNRGTVSDKQDPDRPGASRTGQEGQDMEGGKLAGRQPDAGRGNAVSSSGRDVGPASGTSEEQEREELDRELRQEDEAPGAMKKQAVQQGGMAAGTGPDAGQPDASSSGGGRT
ncbi:MAG TPA: hypothetical protein PKA20_15805 [Burkholderiaceae bacterium]|nr:hypothetical protein [Burkholderiaceae bacterium]